MKISTHYKNNNNFKTKNILLNYNYFENNN